VGAEASDGLIMKLSTISRQFIGKKYDLGKCDCFSIVRDYLQMKGTELPDKYEGYDIFNDYADLWEKNPNKAKDLMMQFFVEYTDQIPAFKMKAGDILHLKLGDGHFCGIHGGHGHVIGASPDRGVTMFKIVDYEILGVYRCRS
jgi:hypothetical protein